MLEGRPLHRECTTPHGSRREVIFHVLEYVWEAAGRFLHSEGTEILATWVRKQEQLLYSGKAVLVIQHIEGVIPTVGKRAANRLKVIRHYLMSRLRMLNYQEARAQDLEIASGMVEGSVKHVIAKRMDSGGMRWIRERAQALLQLRCIEINGDWKDFTAFVAARLQANLHARETTVSLLTGHPESPPDDCAA